MRMNDQKIDKFIEQYTSQMQFDLVTMHNQDNLQIELQPEIADVVYCDMIYESLDFSFVDKYWKTLKPNGIFIIQTDYHSVAEIKVYTQKMQDANFINWLTWKNEFGNFRKDRFRQCHDDILIFCKGKHYKWYPERVQVEKATAKSKGLNRSGRTTKLATSVITDICLTTVSKERIKKGETCIRWQKPIALIDRLLSPFTDEGDLVIDPYMGSGTVGEWSLLNNRCYIGIENDLEVFQLAVNRINNVAESLHEQNKF